MFKVGLKNLVVNDASCNNEYTSPVNYGIKPYFIFSNVPEVKMDEFGSALQMLNFCTQNNLS